MVLKTAELTPLSALYVSKLFLEVGLPPGVLNVISGFSPIAGAALCSHMDVDKILEENLLLLCVRMLTLIWLLSMHFLLCSLIRANVAVLDLAHLYMKVDTMHS